MNNYEKNENTQYNDTPTKVKFLGWRFAYTFFAYVITGLGITNGNSFFTQITLFVLPLFMDYFRYMPDTKGREKLQIIGICVTGFWLLTGLIGVFGILELVSLQKGVFVQLSQKYIFYGFSVRLTYFWLAMSICVFLTVIDWFFFGYKYTAITKTKQSKAII